jgi:molecular chaperone GrpE
VTEHDERRERDEARPKVRVVDKRRFTESSEGEPPAPSDAPRPEEAGDELAKARADATEYRDHLQRLQAEFDNYRKRVLKEQTRAVELAAQPAMLRLLEVLDEFDLALMAADRPTSSSSAEASSSCTPSSSTRSGPRGWSGSTPRTSRSIRPSTRR